MFLCGPFSIVFFERDLQSMELVVKRSSGKLEPVEQLSAIARHEGHPARADRAVASQEWLDEHFPVGGECRVADEQGSALLVVANHRLEMGTLGFNRRQCEWNFSVQERDGCFPGEGELACDESVPLGPCAFAVIGRAVVADRIGDLEMIGLFPPVSPGGCQSRGSTGLMMLTHEVDIQKCSPPPDFGVLEPGGDGEEEWVATLLRQCCGGRDFSAAVGGVTAPAEQPAPQAALDQRGA